MIEQIPVIYEYNMLYYTLHCDACDIYWRTYLIHYAGELTRAGLMLLNNCFNRFGVSSYISTPLFSFKFCKCTEENN